MEKTKKKDKRANQEKISARLRDIIREPGFHRRNDPSTIASMAKRIQERYEKAERSRTDSLIRDAMGQQ